MSQQQREQQLQQPPLPSEHLVGTFSERLLIIQERLSQLPPPRLEPEELNNWQRIRKSRGLILSILLLVLLPLLQYFLFINPQAGRSVFEIGEPVVIGKTDLCPGDSLFFSINAVVKESGVYRLAMSTWRVTPPPATYTFSDGLDMVMSEPREFPIEILWVVPSTFSNLATGKDEPWPAGDYTRDISVTATGRNTSSEPRQVKFKIREDCPHE